MVTSEGHVFRACCPKNKCAVLWKGELPRAPHFTHARSMNMGLAVARPSIKRVSATRPFPYAFLAALASPRQPSSEALHSDTLVKLFTSYLQAAFQPTLPKPVRKSSPSNRPGDGRSRRKAMTTVTTPTPEANRDVPPVHQCIFALQSGCRKLILPPPAGPTKASLSAPRPAGRCTRKHMRYRSAR